MAHSFAVRAELSAAGRRYCPQASAGQCTCNGVEILGEDIRSTRTTSSPLSRFVLTRSPRRCAIRARATTSRHDPVPASGDTARKRSAQASKQTCSRPYRSANSSTVRSTPYLRAVQSQSAIHSTATPCGSLQAKGELFTDIRNWPGLSAIPTRLAISGKTYGDSLDIQ